MNKEHYSIISDAKKSVNKIKKYVSAHSHEINLTINHYMSLLDAVEQEILLNECEKKPLHDHFTEVGRKHNERKKSK